LVPELKKVVPQCSLKKFAMKRRLQGIEYRCLVTCTRRRRKVTRLKIWKMKAPKSMPNRKLSGRARSHREGCRRNPIQEEQSAVKEAMDAQRELDKLAAMDLDEKNRPLKTNEMQRLKYEGCRWPRQLWSLNAGRRATLAKTTQLCPLETG
jgi:hypothetical protein